MRHSLPQGIHFGFRGLAPTPCSLLLQLTSVCFGKSVSHTREYLSLLMSALGVGRGSLVSIERRYTSVATQKEGKEGVTQTRRCVIRAKGEICDWKHEQPFRFRRMAQSIDDRSFHANLSCGDRIITAHLLCKTAHRHCQHLQAPSSSSRCLCLIIDQRNLVPVEVTSRASDHVEGWRAHVGSSAVADRMLIVLRSTFTPLDQIRTTEDRK